MNKQQSQQKHFFSEHQWATIEAAMARIIPTDDLPGAREANTVGFVDRYLSGIDYVWAEPDGSGFQKLTGRLADAWRQRIDTLRETYRAGVEELDRLSNERHSSDFASLLEEQQDDVLSEMESDGAGDAVAESEDQATAGFEPATAEAPDVGMQQTLTELELAFFDLLCFQTRQGFYSDPIYGGNRDHVGWEVLNFPGPKSMKEIHDGTFDTLPYFAPEGE